MSNEKDNEAIQDALYELTILRIVIENNDGNDVDFVKIDRDRLSLVGYTLVFDGVSPKFIKLDDLQYIYNPILWVDDYIPKSSLSTYVISKMKCGYSSF
jgi:hypothetical protein